MIQMTLEFSGEIIYWRGPSPYYFVAVPPEQSSDIKAISGLVTYGWGCIPVYARIGATEYKTSLFPRVVANLARPAGDRLDGERNRTRRALAGMGCRWYHNG